VSFPIELFVIHLLKKCSVILVFDIMLKATFVTIASAGEIAVLNSCGHPFQYVIIIVI
jgi:hypothetical protein